MPEWMTESVILALIGFFGAVGTAFLTYLGVKSQADRKRLDTLETRSEKIDRQNVGLWAYCRALIDHIYKGGGPPPPDPPRGIMEMFD